MVEIISLEDVYTALCSSKPTLYKAVVGLIFSSTMAPVTISNLTLNDLLMACEDYFNEDEEVSLENLLKKDPWKIIPCWKLKSKNIITFNTPETTFYLFLYLKEKRMDDLGNLQNPLFKRGKNKFLTSSKISSYVTEFNAVLNLLNEDYGNNFKSKNLIATFKEIYDKQLYIEIENKNSLIKLFEGKLANNSKFYRYAVRNPQKIKEYYMMLIPYLTSRSYNVGGRKDYRNYSDDKKMISGVIQDFYDTELKGDLNLGYTQGQLLCKFAGDLTNSCSFSNDMSYLNKLFKKAMIKLKVHNYDFMRGIGFLGNYVDKNSNPEIYAKKLEEDSYKLGIYDLIDISRDVLYKHFIDYVISNNYYNGYMNDYEAKKIIKNVCYALIDENKDMSFNSS